MSKREPDAVNVYDTRAFDAETKERKARRQRLIEAAPLMLEALEALYELAKDLDDCGPYDESWQSPELVSALGQVRAAIAKARGGK